MSKWNWTSALVGATASAAAAMVVLGRPRDPTFHLISISLSNFHLHLPVLDAELILTVHVTNPNIVPIEYSPATMSIFYAGSLLGSAEVQAGSQPAMSCQLLHLHARLDGLQLANHAVSLLADAAARHMMLDASVNISGSAKVLWWAHQFKVHVKSHVVVDPVYLDVVDQDNQSETQLFT